MNKVMTETEVRRVEDLMKVWEYLYNNKAYDLCDYISKEIGVIKGTMAYDE